jgi:hypothetical protein
VIAVGDDAGFRPAGRPGGERFRRIDLGRLPVTDQEERRTGDRPGVVEQVRCLLVPVHQAGRRDGVPPARHQHEFVAPSICHQAPRQIEMVLTLPGAQLAGRPGSEIGVGSSGVGGEQDEGSGLGVVGGEL